MSIEVEYLGFFRPKSSISDHWSYHTVKDLSGGHFEMRWTKLSVLEKKRHMKTETLQTNSEGQEKKMD